MAPVRVLHIVTYMGLGGIETMLMNYYRHIDRSKLQFDFLVHRDFEAAYDAEILALGGRIHRLPRLNPFHPSYYSALDRFFREHPEYQIVHSHLDCMAGIPLKAAAKHGIPIRIAHAHNSSQAYDLKYPVKLYFKRLISKYATELFACSQAAGNWMFSGAPFQLLTNAIDLERFSAPHISSAQEPLHIPEGFFVIGHIGRFYPQKNHRQILQIFKAVLLQNPATILLLIGDGPLMEQTVRQARQLHIEKNIIFAGQRTDIPTILHSMDVFILPSIHEGLPVSLIEAQAAGLPCIVSDSVSSECTITPLVQQLSLKESAEKWADVILSVSKGGKQDVTQQIIDAGFDIRSNAKQLQNFYLSYETK